MLDETLYNVATAGALLTALVSVIDGYQNMRAGAPSVQMTVLMALGIVCSTLRIPLLLGDRGTARELYLFGGSQVLQLLAVLFNVLAFRAPTLTALAATLTACVIASCVLMARRLRA